jgi:hypothetical protein
MACAIASLFVMAIMVGIVAVTVAFAKDKPSARRPETPAAPSGNHAIPLGQECPPNL